jgi:hypothetical protein
MNKKAIGCVICKNETPDGKRFQILFYDTIPPVKYEDIIVTKNNDVEIKAKIVRLFYYNKHLSDMEFLIFNKRTGKDFRNVDFVANNTVLLGWAETIINNSGIPPMPGAEVFKR